MIISRHQRPAVLVKLIINKQEDPKKMAKDALRYYQAIEPQLTCVLHHNGCKARATMSLEEGAPTKISKHSPLHTHPPDNHQKE
uniref:Uncharacterized protein n=1 Tax=Timema poppense TaxID=170557 RepID=A0A7R9DW42_TIMPO|nr:unnamed protein product [Timema poppensis]